MPISSFASVARSRFANASGQISERAGQTARSSRDSGYLPLPEEAARRVLCACSTAARVAWSLPLSLANSALR